jgi:protein-S-isoprenylcysteine O-methyltransferase Ste14
MDDLKFYAFLGSQALATLVLLVLVAFWPGSWKAQRMVGSVLLVAGMAFVFTARLQLGHSFSVIPRAKKLVTHGLYSKIRNPIYVFGTMASAGMFLILQIPRLWVVLLVLGLIQVLRARKEARVLAAKFGDEYRAYRSQTWF